MVVLLIFILIISSVIIISYKLEERDIDNEYKKISEEAIDWHKKELAKPRSAVLARTKSGQVYGLAAEEPRYDIEYFIGWNFYEYSSDDLAIAETKRCFERGYFYYPQEELRIPMCEIEYIKVVQYEV